MSGKTPLLALGALLLAASGARAAEPCKLLIAAELPVTMRGLRPLVPIRINGQDTLMVADSGAFFSTLSPAAADQLKLKPGVAPFGLAVKGVGGTMDASVVVADEMLLGQTPLKKMQFLVVQGVAQATGDAAGLLGRNVLGFTDVEYDLANGAIRMVVPKGQCQQAKLAYWIKGDQAFGVVDIESTGPERSGLQGRATINGQPIRVTFDTGASVSVLKRSAAERLGFRKDGPDVRSGGLTRGIGQRQMETWIAPFASFEIGGEAIKNTHLRVADMDFGDADMIIGADFFLAHRVYVSNKRHKIYFTYNGGPVFRLERDPQAATAASTSTPAADEPSDAAGYARRGSAHAARRDFERAVADLTRAIELAPNDPGHYAARAEARLGARQPALALVDFDQALKLKPDNTRALLGRGAFHLANGEHAKADADFEAAATAAGPESSLRMTIGRTYTDSGRYDRAIAQYDAWIAAHPKDVGLPAALNERCWARGLWDKQLEQALADCDSAIKRGGRTAAYLDSRGLVKLRLGRHDAAIADYDAALKLQPKQAWSLYSRGLVKIAKGDKVAGEADLAAAAAMDPSVLQRAKQYGLAPTADAAMTATAP